MSDSTPSPAGPTPEQTRVVLSMSTQNRARAAAIATQMGARSWLTVVVMLLAGEFARFEGRLNVDGVRMLEQLHRAVLGHEPAALPMPISQAVFRVTSEMLMGDEGPHARLCELAYRFEQVTGGYPTYVTLDQVMWPLEELLRELRHAEGTDSETITALVSKCCMAPIVDGPPQEGGFVEMLCATCGASIGVRADFGTLDLGVVRDEVSRPDVQEHDP